MKNIYFILAIVACAIFASCDKAVPDTACKDLACFNVDSFDTQIKRRLNGNCVGYGYTINVNGNVHSFGSGGYQRLDQDPPKTIFSDFDPFNPASLSKMITGVALMQILDAKGLSPSEPIWSHLPATWTLGNNVETITFKDLLTHKSGLRSVPFTPTDYTHLKALINTGVTLENKAINSYDNANFGLMRVLIAKLNGESYSGSEIELDTAYGVAYEKYVNDHIFSVLGIPYLHCYPTMVNGPLSYPFPDKGVNGSDFGNYITDNGQAGWNISVVQYNQVMREAFFGTKLIPAGLAKKMREDTLAFDYFGAGNTFYPGTTYVSKNGGFPASPGVFNGQFTLFSNDVSIVLFVNSDLIYPSANKPAITQLILDAFDAAHK